MGLRFMAQRSIRLSVLIFASAARPFSGLCRGLGEEKLQRYR